MPLHHQMVLNKSLIPFMDRRRDNKTLYTYSSMKGSSNVMNGIITFHSDKMSLIVSSNNDHFVKSMVDRIFQKHVVKIGKMLMMPKLQQVISNPEFKEEMKYVCLAPFVLIDSGKEPERAETIIDPNTQEFSDLLFNSTMERMHKAGFTEDELKEFQTFEVIGDQEYLKKTVENNKRFARFYRNLDRQTIVGYLLPFTLHAHPKVQQFIFETGLGLYGLEGYGMIDIVHEQHAPLPLQNSLNEDDSTSVSPTADGVRS